MLTHFKIANFHTTHYSATSQNPAKPSEITHKTFFGYVVFVYIAFSSYTTVLFTYLPKLTI